MASRPTSGDQSGPELRNTTALGHLNWNQVGTAHSPITIRNLALVGKVGSQDNRTTRVPRDSGATSYARGLPMNVPVSSLRIVRVVVARVGSGVVEVGGVTGVIGEAAIGGILADGESHAAAMTSKTNRAVKRRITPTPFVTVEFAKSRRGGDENLAMLHLARGSGQRSTECDVRGGWVLSDADPLQVFTYMTVSGSMLCRRSLGVSRSASSSDRRKTGSRVRIPPLRQQNH